MLSEKETGSSSSDVELLATSCTVVTNEEVSFAHINSKSASSALSITTTKELESSLHNSIETEDWSHLGELLESFPCLARARLTIIIHGERTPCLPLHAVCARRLPSLDVLEKLIAFYPSALREGDHRGRLPLHLALLRGCASKIVIRYLCDCSPHSLMQKDYDGNVPFHYACQFASNEIIQCIISVCPEAAMVLNEKNRLALHLVCSRNWDLEGPCVRSVLEAYPEAAQECDRLNRLPLHWACDQPHLRYDVLATLVKQYPGGLLHRDNTSASPVQLAKRMQAHGEEQGVVLAF